MIRHRKVEIIWFDIVGPKLKSTSMEDHIFSVGFHAERMVMVSSLYLKGSSPGFRRSKSISCEDDEVLHVFGDVGETTRLTQLGKEEKVL